MKENGLFGHLFPTIDEDRCSDCGLCKKFCPSLSNNHLTAPKSAYAAWSKDLNEYKSSASGGVASVLAREIINQGGVVYGCSMMPNINVKHIRIVKIEDIHLLKGSKYVQSSIVDILPSLKKDVSTGVPTLFIGTPCQNAAVKAMFKTPPPNLFLVDLVCHGVPSLKFLKECVKKVADYPSYDNVSFRDSNGFCTSVTVKGEIVYKMPLFTHRYKELYLNTFFDGFTYRDSCYSCQYAQPNRISDITIGDFWGLGKEESAEQIPPHPFGCSLIMPYTEKGISLLNLIKSKMNLYERTVSEAVNGNDQLRQPKLISRRIRIYRTFLKYVYYPKLYNLLMSDLIIKSKLRKPRKK